MQLSMTQTGLYLCIRHPPSETRIVSAPPQDRWAYVSLVPPETTANEKSIDAIIAVESWLWAFATKFKEWLESQLQEFLHMSQEPHQSKEAVWPSFAKHVVAVLLNDIVPGFRMKDSKLAVRAQSSLAGSAQSSPGENPLHLACTPASSSESSQRARDVLLREIHDAACVKVKEYDAYMFAYQKSIDREEQDYPEAYVEESLSEAFQALEDLIPDGHYCFLAIDEAASMGSLRLTELRRCLSRREFEKIRVLLLDTSNKVTELTGMTIAKDTDGGNNSGDDTEEPSLRLAIEELELAPPFTRFPYNVNLWGNAKNASTYKSIVSGSSPASFKRIHRFLPLMGRPLMRDRYWRPDQTNRWLNGTSLDALYNKLLALSPSDTAVSPGRPSTLDDLESTDATSRAIAAAAQRLPLDLIGARGEIAIRNIVCHLVLIYVLAGGTSQVPRLLLHSCLSRYRFT